MYIKRLEIVGFKSFTDKTNLILNKGISAVVGPNGCGKSNIIDAIRWVMGEQSPKTLRGGQMDDVLFNGSQTRPPAALAEVSITLAQSQENNNAGYLEASITRRLYRNGDSEYLINKNICRLKDVSQFFMELGMGTKAYGIIEQGRVGFLVDAKDEERRLLIDEAAGITRYKVQKRESERKIETAKQNLISVSALMNEAQKQLNYINKAAEKALKYQVLRKELKQLDFTLLAKKLLNLKNQFHENTAKQQEKEEKLSLTITLLNKVDLKTETDKFELLNLEENLENNLNAWHQAENEKQALEQDLKYMFLNVENNEKRFTSNLLEIKRLKSDEKKYLEEKLNLETQLKTLKIKSQKAIEEREFLRENWQVKKNNLQNFNNQQSENNVLLNKETANLNNIIKNSFADEALLKHQKEQKENFKTETKKLKENYDTVKLERENLKKEAVETFKNLNSFQEELTFKEEEKKIVFATLENLKKELNIWENKKSAALAKIKTLENIKTGFLWYPNNIKTLMNNKELITAGLIGPLAENIKIPVGYEKAIEAFLADKLSWLLVKNKKAALLAIQYLYKNNLGRCGFINLEALANKEDFIKELLGNFTVQENISLTDRDNTILTAQGDYISNLYIVGGNIEKSDEKGLLSRLKDLEIEENNLKEIELNLKKQEKEKLKFEENYIFLTEEITIFKNKVNELQNKNNKYKNNLILTENNLNNYQERFKNLNQEEESLINKIFELENIIKQKLNNKVELENNVNKLTEDNIKLIEEINIFNSEINQIREEGELAAIEASTLEERLENSKNEFLNINNWLNGLDENINLKNKDLNKIELENKENKNKITFIEESLKKYPQLLEEKQKNIADLKNNINLKRDKIKNQEEEIKNLRKEREALLYIINDIESNMLENKFETEKKEEYLLNSWNVIMLLSSEIGKEPHNIENENKQIENINYWAELQVEETAEEKQKQLRYKIKSLGSVNLEAITEKASLEERAGFYTSQYTDLLKALNNLKESIKKINETCQLRFLKTFNEVNEKFKEVFPVLFEGGEAWLSLTDENDILESGVEINVHPPGKKIMVMSLLSGGEKALTALAVIFALYLIKPSPFCLLDETDAPLDEANVIRYTNLLKKLSVSSQIIMVTHNKKTMQISENLYGVTMETPGVSKLVSVNLKEAEVFTQ